MSTKRSPNFRSVFKLIKCEQAKKVSQEIITCLVTETSQLPEKPADNYFLHVLRNSTENRKFSRKAEFLTHA